MTQLSEIIASLYNNSSGENNYEFLLFNGDTSEEDLLGYYQPKSNKNKVDNEIHQLSSLINWNKGPVYNAIEKGIPVILDDLGYAKSQILESLNSILETNIKYKYNEFKFKVLQQNRNDLKIEKGSKFTVIGTIKEEHLKYISKALINRFVVIYVDEIKINENNIENYDIVNKTITNLNFNIELLKKMTNETNDNNIHFIKQINPNISQYLISLLKSKKINLNIKYTVKLIEKLCLIYQKFNCRISLEDCYSLLELFENDENETKTIEEVLKRNKTEIEIIFKKMFTKYEESQKESDFFFYDSNIEDINLSDSLKMIIGIILSDLSNTSIFIQGYPGSGKSCAGRFYGAKRSFNNRDPIISVSCNSDLVLESLIGTYSYKDSNFEFVPGPLLIAMEKGEPILLDEFNLCHESIFFNLLSVFKAKVNDEINLKYVPYKVKINPGFFIIATGNFSKERGRKQIPKFILNEINLIKVNHFSYDKNILEKIMNKRIFLSIQRKNEDEDDNFKISVEQIIKIFEVLKEITQVNFSIRQIKCLLERITRFKNLEIIYIIIGYIIPQINVSEELILKFLEKINEIMNYKNLDELKMFLKSDVIMVYKENKKYIRKGKIELKINFNFSHYPQAALQTLFWIRMSCSETNSIPSNENLLLIGPTCYKETILKDWLESVDKKGEIYFLTKNTEVQNLIGGSSLDDGEKLDILIDQIRNDFKESYECDVEDKKFDNLLIEEKDPMKNHCMKYINKCYKYLNKLRKDLKKNKDGNLNMITSFHLGIIPSSFIYGKILILKGIENPSPSVIERMNSLIENKRYLVLTEDNQGIFNNRNIFEEVYENKSKITLPHNPNFRIIFTSRNSHNKLLSEAFKSRCTIINCPSYKDDKYLLMELKPNDNYEKILKKYMTGIPDLEKEMTSFKLKYKENIDFLSFIRFCKSAKNIYETYKNNYYVYQDTGIIYKNIVGVAALRSILDKLNSQERSTKIKNYLQNFLPEKLFNLLIDSNDYNNNLQFPFEIIEDNFKSKRYVKSIYSNISIEVQEVNKDCINKIIWTKSSIDIADAFLTALAAKTILILEGPPGRGKTAITDFMYEYLYINYQRINFCPSTKKEEVFSMVVPTVEKNKIVTKNIPQKLIKILEDSKNNKNIFEYGLLLDEMNLSKEELREDLYSYLGAIKNNDNKNNEYTAPDGTKYSDIGNIAVTITMNGSTMSNSRTSLSDSFLNLSHTFLLQNYTKDEVNKLITEKMKNVKGLDKADIDHIIYKHNLYANENRNNTFREVMKIHKYFKKIESVGLDELLDLILYPEKKISVNDWDLRLDKNNLFFGKSDNYIKYPLDNKNQSEIRTLFTPSQKEALLKILVGIKAENTILLTGEINSGKTYIIEQLANLIGIRLRTIQFTKETNSTDLIGKLQLTKKNMSLLKSKLNNVQNHLIEKEFKDVSKFIIYNKSMAIPELLNILKDIDENKDIKKDIIFIKEELNQISILNNINFDFI